MVAHWLKSHGVISLCGSFFNSTSSPAKDPSIVYALRWETMPENQDQPRSPVPAPTPLMLYKFIDPNVATPVKYAVSPGRPEKNVPLIFVSAKKIHLSLPPTWQNAPGTVRIIDCKGKEVARDDVAHAGNDISIEMNSINVQSGFYLVSLRAGALTWKGRVVIIR